ncbi:MAG: RagB/SusD family nutrient uptake outer membrane protein [Bacteroidota bacterium]
MKSSKLKVLIIASLTIFSCSEEFLDRPPEDSFSVTDFYRTNAEVESATIALYLRPWYDFITSASWPIGELASGNAFTFDGRNADFVNFAVNGNHENIDKAWNSLYAVVAQSNAVINTLPDAVSSTVDEEVVNNALGEARMIRAVAYFYLVRIFGAIPIIDNNFEAVQELGLRRNPVSDVYTFIIRDLQFAIENCYDTPRSTTNYEQNERVTSGSAKAMLAKVYLYQQNYTEAYRLADEVISAGSFKLYGGDAEDGDSNGSYYRLFMLANDNNPESIFSLQWGASGNYAEGNGLQSFFAQSGLTGFTDGFSSAGPSIDLQEAYEDTANDVRFYSTIQSPGNFYPDVNGGFTVPTTIDVQRTNAGIKKYVIGESNGSPLNYPNNTYIMRYADLLLIHAEAAIMGGGDLASGVTSFNKVRRRAGLPDIANPSMDDVFQERRIELAFEFEFWYDVVRRHGVAGFDAINFLSNTERGTYFQNNPPILISQNYTASEEDLTFPYPVTELQDNPDLSEEPVPFDFGN